MSEDANYSSTKIREQPAERPSVSVVIVTYSRPDCVRRVLEHLREQTVLPWQVIVVDSDRSPNTKNAIADFGEVVYLRNEYGYGGMTISRNIGLVAATGNIVAYVDDDALPEKLWVENIIDGYSSDQIGGVGGRALNNEPGEASNGVDAIGIVTKNGVVTGNFAADPGKIIEVDHIIGCNMTFRRDVLLQLGGFRTDFPGNNLGEDTDMSFRVRRQGYKIMFNPAAVVNHLGAPQPIGQRFDVRWDFYNHQNGAILMIRNYGFSSIVLRSLFHSTYNAVWAFIRKIIASSLRLGAALSGLSLGVWIGTIMLAKNGLSPIRRESNPQKDK